MNKLAITLVIVFLGFFIFRLFQEKTPEVSPLGQKEQEEFQKKLQDKKIFEENKDKVAAEIVNWAVGDAKPHPIVADPASYIVVDKEGKAVYALNPDSKRPPASLIKLVVAMVAIDLVEGNEAFKVEKDAVGMEPTTIMVDEGEEFNRDELLTASLITSANDAAKVLADGIAKKLGGSKDLFVMLMNEKVKNMGLANTHFVNPTGYDDPNQYSTPRELAKIAHYAMIHYPLIAKLVKTYEMTLLESSEHKYYELPNWNGLLGVYPGVYGVKIGYTEGAGYVTTVASNRDREDFTAVLLGAPDRRARDFWAANLLNSAFSDSGIKPFRVTLSMIKQKETKWGEQLERAKLNTHVWINKNSGGD